jgi:uncharacterized protein involved in exopolysaccharide biosynthesis
MSLLGRISDYLNGSSPEVKTLEAEIEDSTRKIEEIKSQLTKSQSGDRKKYSA